MRELHIIRGVPGSGKSTLARRMKQYYILRGIYPAHYEQDMFFTGFDGTYNWRPERILDAVKWCQEKTAQALIEDRTVIVSNTFVKWEHVESYLDIAMKHGANRVTITECQGRFENIHGVPGNRVMEMRRLFESPKDLLFRENKLQYLRDFEVRRMIEDGEW